MKKLPLVSVIALCYNHAPFVLEALRSVVHQTYPNLELLIVDDTSTDKSVAAIESFLPTCPIPVRFIPFQKNQGNCKAFNYAFRRAKGEFIIDLATDDVLFPDRISRQIAAFQALDESYGIVFTNAERIDATGKTLGLHYRDTSSVPSGDLYQDLLRPGGLISAPTMLIKRQVLEILDGYDETLAYEDYDFWVRSSRQFKYFFLDEVLTKRRVTPDSLGQKFYARGNENPMLVSTLRVCRKAQQLNQNPAENEALLQSVRYHLRQALFTHQFELTRSYAVLRDELSTHVNLTDYFWDLLSRWRIPLGRLYRLYRKLL